MQTSADALTAKLLTLCLFAATVQGCTEGKGPVDGGLHDEDGSVEDDATTPEDAAEALPDDGGEDDTDAAMADLDASLPETDAGLLDAASDSSVLDASGSDAAVTPCLAEGFATGDVLLTSQVALSDVQVSASRVLTLGAGRWTLSDRTTKAVVATGAGVASAVLRGDSLVLQSGDTVEVRRASDGAPSFSVPFSGLARSGIAQNASYVWVATETELRAFSTTTRAQALSKSGNYARASIVALAGELRVAGGLLATPPERIPLSGQSTLVPYTGKPAKLFADGGRFFAEGDGNLRVFDMDGSARGTYDVTPGYDVYGGYGDFIWARNLTNGVRIYRIGNQTPVSAYYEQGKFYEGPSDADGMDSWFVFWEKSRGTTFIDLTTSVPTERVVGGLLDIRSVDATGQDLYFVTRVGTVAELTRGAMAPTMVGCGEVQDVALAKSGSFAVATAGQVLVSDLSSRAIRFTIAQDAKELSFTRDGKVLVLKNFNEDLNLYDAQSGELLMQVPGLNTGANSPSLRSYDLSADGSRILLTRCVFGMSCENAIVDRSGASLWSESFDYTDSNAFAVSRLSPDALRVARASSPATLSGSSVFVKEGASTIGTTPGAPMVWLDGDRLVTAQFFRATGVDLFGGSSVVDAHGTRLGSTPLREAGVRLTVVRDGSLLFSRASGRMYHALGAANESPVADLRESQVLADANDGFILYIPTAGANAGELRVRTY
ncbi:MAG: hypothetical protein RL385_774 [Pseudomonadota bacterium]